MSDCLCGQALQRAVIAGKGDESGDDVGPGNTNGEPDESGPAAGIVS